VFCLCLPARSPGNTSHQCHPPSLGLCLRTLYACTAFAELATLEESLPHDLVEFVHAQENICYQCMQRFFHSPLENAIMVGVTTQRTPRDIQLSHQPRPVSSVNGMRTLSVILSDVAHPIVPFSYVYVPRATLPACCSLLPSAAFFVIVWLWVCVGAC
jgi:hypothetical protein